MCIVFWGFEVTGYRLASRVNCGGGCSGTESLRKETTGKFSQANTVLHGFSIPQLVLYLQQVGCEKQSMSLLGRRGERYSLSLMKANARGFGEGPAATCYWRSKCRGAKGSVGRCTFLSLLATLSEWLGGHCHGHQIAKGFESEFEGLCWVRLKLS